MKSTQFLLFASLAALVALTWQHHFGPSPKNDPFMQFFQAMNASERQGFFQITANPNVTLHEMKEQLAAFAQQNGIMDAYSAFNATVSAHKAELEAAAPENLTGKALELYNQLKAILNNESVKRGEQCAQVKSLLDSANPVVVGFMPKCMLMACMGVGHGQMAAKMMEMAPNFGQHDEDV